MRRRDLAPLFLCTLFTPRVLAQQSKAGFLAFASDFIDMMVSEHGFSKARLKNLFRDLTSDPKVLKYFEPKEDGKPVYWADYRSRHLSLTVIAAGLAFMQQMKSDLNKAAEIYGVPANILAAIIGIETRYGNYTGNFETFRTLATLGFSDHKRADYFKRELAQLLIFARNEDVDVTKYKGSYAGAIGLPQFMPTSALTWAVDFDEDGHADLFNKTDAIASVANFLVKHGWQKGVPVAFATNSTKNANPQLLLDEGIRPTLSEQQLNDAGFTIDYDGNPPYQGKFALVDLINEDANEYRAGTINYYVITRYNRSNKYAMAVLDLANTIG